MALADFISDPERHGTPDLVELVDAWASEVVALRADALGLGDDPYRGRRRLDDLFGSFRARDRIERVDGADGLFVLQAIDNLLISFTEEVGRQWLGLTGMRDRAGDGWWWGRLPVAGPARSEFDRVVADRPPDLDQS